MILFDIGYNTSNLPKINIGLFWTFNILKQIDIYASHDIK